MSTSPKTPAFTTPSDPSTPAHYPTNATALLLLDFHALFTTPKAGGPSAAAACSTAASLRRWAHSKSMPIAHCLIDVTQTPYATCKDAARFQAMIKAAVTANAAAEPEELTLDAEGKDEATFLRRPGYVSALKSPGLEAWLHEKGVRSLLLAGLSTSGCVLRTAIAASDAEFVVCVVSDGCADPGEEMHEIVLGRLLNRGWVVSAEEVMREVK